MMSNPVYFYLAPIATSEYNAAVGASCHVAAASNKVIGVAKALLMQQRSMRVVSCPITTGESGFKLFPALNLLTKGIHLSFLQSIPIRGLNRIHASFAYLIFLIRNHERKDVVIFYNFFPEYILSALYLLLRGSRAYLDIEDAPRKDEKGVRGVSNRFSYAILFYLCSEKKITAAQTIGKKLKLEKFISVSGVQSEWIDRAVLKKTPIRVLFGGAMMRETGVELFCLALTELASTSIAGDFYFVITGFGDFSRIIQLKKDTLSKISIELMIDCSPSEYREQLLLADVGLCLKISNCGIGETTFPSKSIEIAAGGLLLVTTKISDIPYIFDDSTALLLDSDSPLCLFDAFVAISNNRASFSEVALAGQKLVSRKFSLSAVGSEVISFLEER